MKPKIVVVGSSNTDMILKLDRIPRPGETLLGGEFVTAAGGKGANQAVAAAKAGGAVTLVARVGKDMFGEQAVAGFVESGINVDYMQYDKCASGVALIFVAKDGENSIGVGGGANAKLSPADVRRAKPAFANADVVIMQLETPLETVQAAADLAAASGARVILNPAPAQALPDKLLKKISILTPNETEAELLTGVKVTDEVSCSRAADILLGKGIRTVIITLGARGSFMATALRRNSCPVSRLSPSTPLPQEIRLMEPLLWALAEGLADARCGTVCERRGRDFGHAPGRSAFCAKAKRKSRSF